MTGVQIVDEWPDEAVLDFEKKRLCRKCGEYLSVSVFPRQGKWRDCTTCTRCAKGVDDWSYPATPLQRREANWGGYTNARARNRDFVLDHFTSHPCVDCGETDTAVLEFDHLPDKGAKIANVSNLVYRGASLQQLQNEIAKCEVVCANDHKRRTDARRNKSRTKSMKS